MNLGIAKTESEKAAVVLATSLSVAKRPSWKKPPRMGTIVDTKHDGEKFQYHFRQDPRFHTPNPPIDAYWLEGQIELWHRPSDAEVNFINKLVKGR